MAKGDTTRTNKRKFGSGKGSPYAAAPRKGPPAIFVTCESGREKKCQREALELMHHYYYLSKQQAQDEINDTKIHNQTPSCGDHVGAKGDDNVTNDINDNDDEQKQQQEKQPLSLEEELSLLRKGVMAEEVLTYERNPKRHKGDDNNANHGNKNKLSSMKSPFSVHDSGVRGMICILCNLPGSEVIPYDDIVAKIHAARKEKAAENETSSTINDSSEDIKIRENEEIGNEEDKKSDDEKKQTSVETTLLWDPVDTVKRIMEGVVEESNPTNASKVLSSPPSSRFITRMLPMQATVSVVVSYMPLTTFLPAMRFTFLHFHYHHYDCPNSVTPLLMK